MFLYTGPRAGSDFPGEVPLMFLRSHLFALATSFVALSLVAGGCTGKVGAVVGGMGGNSNSGAAGDSNSGAAGEATTGGAGSGSPGVAGSGTLAGVGGMGNNTAGDPPKLNTTHPRLWMTDSDLATLRSWAVWSHP